MSLATKLLAKKTTLVGTIRGNKRELPKAAKQTKDNMPRFSTLLYKSENCVLTIYKSKPNERVAVLSSKHKFVKIDKSNKKNVTVIMLNVMLMLKIHQNMKTHKDQLQHHQMQPILTNTKFVKYDFATTTKQIIYVKNVKSMFAEDVHIKRFPLSFA
jgi:hypothetical protein